MIHVIPIFIEDEDEGEVSSNPFSVEDLRTLHEALVIAEYHSSHGETLEQYDRAHGIAAARKRTDRIRALRLKTEKLQGV